MKDTIYVKLERPAKKSGGDRYLEIDGDFQIYIPQKLSRESGEPYQLVAVTLENVETTPDR